MKKDGLGCVLGFLLFFVLRLESLLYSIPVWLTLILHFVIGLPIFWFIIAVCVWFLLGLIRYGIIRFARWGAASKTPEKENKNPYSAKNEDYFRK